MEFLHTLHLLRKQLAANIGASREEIPWCWLAATACSILSSHGTGLTQHLLLAELEHRWHALASLELTSAEIYRTVQPFFHRGTQPSPATVFELQISRLFKLPSSSIWLYQLSGAPAPASQTAATSKRQRRTMDKRIDGFVHQRYHRMVEAREFDGFFRNRAVLSNGWQAMDRNGGQGRGQVELTLLPNPSLAFVIRLTDEPSLPAVRRPSADEQWLERLFGVKYQASSRFVRAPTAGVLADVPKVWCRIACVGEQTNRYRMQRRTEYSWLECVEEHNESRLVRLEFWGDDARMAGLFRANDYVGVLCPQPVSRDDENQAERERTREASVLEYGSQSIAFVMQAIKPDSTVEPRGLSQIKAPRDERGRLDYSRYAHRVRISQLAPDMVKLTLLARVVAVSDNLRVCFDDGSYRDRYVLRIEDGKEATCDVTLWDEVGQGAAAAVRAGQLVVLKWVQTREQGGGMAVDGGRGIDTELYNVSTMNGILAGQGLRGLTRLACLETPSNVYVKGVVLQVVCSEEAGATDARDWCGGATVLVHGVCGDRLVGVDVPSRRGRLQDVAERYAWECRRCGIQHVSANAIRSAFSLAVELDDGSDCRQLELADSASRTLLGLAPGRLLNIPGQDEQREQLAKCMGTEIVASVSVFGGTARIDALCLAKDVGLLSI